MSERLSSLQARQFLVELLGVGGDRSKAQVRVILLIAAFGPLHTRRLAKECNLPLPAMAQSVYRLEMAGLIQRVKGVSARDTKVHLTSAGSDEVTRYETELLGILDRMTNQGGSPS